MDKSLILNKLILHYAEGSTTKFAKMLGISQQALSNWKNRGTLDYEKIYTICDGLNPHWLLTGEGEMLLTESVNKNVSKTEKCKQTDVESDDSTLIRIANALDEILARLPQNPEKNGDVGNFPSMCG